jgi:hypothetical protein
VAVEPSGCFFKEEIIRTPNQLRFFDYVVDVDNDGTFKSEKNAPYYGAQLYTEIAQVLPAKVRQGFRVRERANSKK